MLTLFASYIEEHEDEILDELKEYYFEEGEKKGEKKGKREGKREGKKEVAKNFKGLVSDDEISKRTGIPIEEVHNL